jgi:hypothetical protein
VDSQAPDVGVTGHGDVAADGSVGIVGDTVSGVSNRQGIESGRDT